MINKYKFDRTEIILLIKNAPQTRDGFFYYPKFNDINEEKGYISSAEAEAIDIEKLKAFFNPPLTERILNADRVLREYKFFDTISANEAGYEGDSEVLIQGIADCVLEEKYLLILKPM